MVLVILKPRKLIGQLDRNAYAIIDYENMMIGLNSLTITMKLIQLIYCFYNGVLKMGTVIISGDSYTITEILSIDFIKKMEHQF